MPEVIYYVAASLDGYIATADGGTDWLAPFEASPGDYGYSEFYESVDAVVMGRRTYEQALTFGAWPYSERPVWVFSHHASNSTHSGVTVTDVSPAELAAELEERGLRRAYLVGGGALAGSFQAAGLIDEYAVSIMPVVLGSGVPLLGACGSAQGLRLVESRSFADGVLQLRYVPAG